MDQPGNEVFSIRINAEGVKTIRRFGNVVRWVLLANILSVGFYILYYVQFYFAYERSFFEASQGSTDIWMLIQFKYDIWFAAINVIFWVLNIWYYFRAGRQLSKGLQSADEPVFNAAFRQLVLGGIMGFIGTIFNALTMFAWAFNFYRQFNTN